MTHILRGSAVLRHAACTGVVWSRPKGVDFHGAGDELPIFPTSAASLGRVIDARRPFIGIPYPYSDPFVPGALGRVPNPRGRPVRWTIGPSSARLR